MYGGPANAEVDKAWDDLEFGKPLAPVVPLGFPAKNLSYLREVRSTQRTRS